MITKNKMWNLIRKELVIAERSKKLTQKVLEKIKDIPQDENKDREITNGELHNYLTKNVPKKALQLHSRNQNPTFTGSADQVFLKY